MIRIKHRGGFNKVEKFLNYVKGAKYLNELDQCGQLGVEALAAATPVDSGETASSWTFEVERGAEATTISWRNTHVNDGVVIALLLQYGHGTGTGGYVQGQDFINPAMKPVFDRIAEEAWKAVVSA